MKRCCECKRKRDDDDFYWKVRGKTRYSRCKECWRIYIQAHYQKHRAAYCASAGVRRRAHIQVLREYLIEVKGKPCTDCDRSFPTYVMDFHHRSRNEKRAGVAGLIHQHVSLRRLQEEISKCDLLCANCHRIRTHKQRTCSSKGRAPGVRTREVAGSNPVRCT